MSGPQVFFGGLGPVNPEDYCGLVDSGIPHPRPLTAEEERTASDAPLTVLFDALLSDRGLPGGMVDIMRARLERADANELPAKRWEALCGLSCVLTPGGPPGGVVAVLRDVPMFLRTEGSPQLDSVADDLLNEQKESDHAQD